MEGIIVVGVLVLAAAALFVLGTWRLVRMARDRREAAEMERDTARSDAAATWRPEVRHRGTYTYVVVQRSAPLRAGGWRPLDSEVVVARIHQDAAEYEVELARAAATARQRARALNGFRDDGETLSR